MKPETVQQTNKRKRDSLVLQNYVTTARGQRYVEYISNDLVEFGYNNVSFWIPTHQQWFPSSQEFKVQAPTLEEAKILFFDRWKKYIKQRFGFNYVYIESI